MQLLSVLGVRFENGRWVPWEHACTILEIEAVQDSALSRAYYRGGMVEPEHVDILDGARSVFNVEVGGLEAPLEGNIRIYGVRIDKILIGNYKALKNHFANLLK